MLLPAKANIFTTTPQSSVNDSDLISAAENEWDEYKFSDGEIVAAVFSCSIYYFAMKASFWWDTRAKTIQHLQAQRALFDAYIEQGTNFEIQANGNKKITVQLDGKELKLEETGTKEEPALTYSYDGQEGKLQGLTMDAWILIKFAQLNNNSKDADLYHDWGIIRQEERQRYSPTIFQGRAANVANVIFKNFLPDQQIDLNGVVFSDLVMTDANESVLINYSVVEKTGAKLLVANAKKVREKREKENEDTTGGINIGEVFDDACEEFQHVKGAVLGAAKEFTNDAIRKAEAFGNSAVEVSSNVGHVVLDASSNAGHVVAEKAVSAGHAIVNAPSHIGHSVVKGVKSLKGHLPGSDKKEKKHKKDSARDGAIGEVGNSDSSKTGVQRPATVSIRINERTALLQDGDNADERYVSGEGIQ